MATPLTLLILKVAIFISSPRRKPRADLSPPVTYAVCRLDRKDTRSQIAASIRAFGFNNPVLIDRNDEIIAGHSMRGWRWK